VFVQVHPRVRKILQLLRLLHINSGVFVQLNEASLRLLRIVEPYVVWGYPNAKTVHDLVYKRGYGRVLKSRVPLNDNKVVETALGEHDVLCVDDIVHQVRRPPSECVRTHAQIVTCGPKFREVSNFLWPFKLDTPSGGWRNKHAHFVEGGDFGCREEQINALLRKMI
jgi:60S ribosomal protein uL30